WGTLTAVNARTGAIAWQTRLGEYPELTALGVQPTGTPNIGGSIVTASGLVFIGATPDGDFRAFDAKTGEVVWQSALPGYGLATPMTFEGSDGKQYVAIATGGPGSLRGVHLELGAAPDEIVVFTLGGRQAAVRPQLPAAPPVRTAAVSSAPATAALPAGPGRELVQQACGSCHGLDTVTSAHLSADGWKATVSEMVGRGAQLSDAQIATVVKYLAQHYGQP
ncbi:MAG: PQQ-binding-like beta-propeller repeat protein, partial [Terriglobales bacterium]